MPPASLLDAVNALVGDRFAVEREIGRGGMGAVFLARERALERQVAIKVLPPELAARADLRERFLRETRTAAAFSHPHIVPVHAVEERGGVLLFVMGFVEGETLGARVRRLGPLGATDAARVLREVAWALSYAHSQGVVHRDVKPDNILLERATGRAMVTDFGIAKETGEAVIDEGPTPITTAGQVVGTPQFMSPEQAAGEPVDGRSDLYSLGIVGFFALTGRLPFTGPNHQAVLVRQLTAEPPDLAALRPDLPAVVVDAVMRCLAKDPAQRFPTGEALVEALDAMRVAHPEVAPAVRVFEQRAENGLRGIAVLAGLVPVVVSALAEDRAYVDAMIVGVVAVAVMLGIGRGVLMAARELVRKGFRYEDVRDGVRAVAAEGREYCAALRAEPGDAARRRRGWWRRGASVAAGVALIAFATLRLRAPRAVGAHGLSHSGIATAVVGMTLVALAVVATVTDPRRPSFWERLNEQLWSSPIGRALFRLAARGAVPLGAARRTRASATVQTGARSPLAILDALPSGQRAQVARLRADVERLEAEAEALTAREAELDDVLAEAHSASITAGDAVATPPGSDRRSALLDDLVQARRAAAARRARALATLENVRLQLLRFRSGLATPDDVAAELTGPSADRRPPESDLGRLLRSSPVPGG